MRCKNLITGAESTYVGIGARFAVMCAYAQSRGDWNTGDYEARYGALPKQGKHGWYLEDWGCLFDGH